MDKNDPSRWTLQKCRVLGEPDSKQKPSKLQMGHAEPLPQAEPWDRHMTEIEKEKAEYRRKLWKNGRPIQYSLPE